MIEMYGLAEEQWVIDMYKKKEIWAEAYFRGHFMAMAWTTQRAESMNSLIKLSVNQRMSLTDFIKHYSRTLQKLRSDFLTQQDDSEKTRPAVRESPLQSLEEHAASICTKKIIQIVREEIKAEQGLLVENNTKTGEEQYAFVFENYNNPDGAQYSVNIDKCRAIFKCACLKLESDGVPCRHIISAFKLMRITKFPDRSIHPCWLIDTSRILKSKFSEVILIVEQQQIRFAQLNKELLNLSYLSSRMESGFAKYLMQIRKISNGATKKFLKHNDIEAYSVENSVYGDIKISSDNVGDPPISTKSSNVNDPRRIKTRGGRREKRQNCSFCGEPGHKANTCVSNPATANRHTNARAKKSRFSKETSSTEQICTQNSVGSSHMSDDVSLTI